MSLTAQLGRRDDNEVSIVIRGERAAECATPLLQAVQNAIGALAPALNRAEEWFLGAHLGQPMPAVAILVRRPRADGGSTLDLCDAARYPQADPPAMARVLKELVMRNRAAYRTAPVANVAYTADAHAAPFLDGTVTPVAVTYPGHHWPTPPGATVARIPFNDLMELVRAHLDARRLTVSARLPGAASGEAAIRAGLRGGMGAELATAAGLALWAALQSEQQPAPAEAAAS